MWLPRHPPLRALAAAALGLACLCLGAACGGQPRPPGGFAGFADDQVRTGAHFRYHAHADDPWVCDGTLDELERDFAAITAELGIAWPGGDRVDYFKFRSSAELTATGVCQAAGVACTADGAVFAPELLNEHELVHAYLARVGQPPTFVEEGIAVVLSCRPGQFSADVLAAAAAVTGPALAAWSRDPAAVLPLYAAAATLVRDLLARFGAAAFLDYYRRAAKKDPTAVDAAFAAAFGAGIDASLAAAQASLGAGTFCADPFACGAPPLDLGGAAAAVEDRCGVDTSYRTLALPEATLVAVSEQGGGSTQIFACDQQGHAPAATVGRIAGGGGGTLLAPLAAGRYSLRHNGTPVVSAGMLSAAAADPAWLAPACDGANAGAYPFDQSPNELDLAAPRDTGAWYARVSVPEASSVYAGAAGLSSGATGGPVALCPSCADLPAATDPACLLATSGDQALTIAGSYALTLPTDGAQDDFAVVMLTRYPPIFQTPGAASPGP
jgi:hypothetical protein